MAKRRGKRVGRGVAAVGSVWSWLLLGAALAPVLLATLTPQASSWSGGGWLCVFCGSYGGANVVRNILLFVPLGGALAALFGAGRRALLMTFAVTAAIELLQFHIPGRYPGLMDVAANFTGGAIAVLLLHGAAWWINPPVRRGAWLSVGWATIGSAVLLSTAALFSVDLPRGAYRVHWTPEFGGFEAYEGTVLSASAGGVDLSARFVRDSRVLRTTLLAGETLEAEIEAGPPTPGLAPVLAVYQEPTLREVILLGVDGEDLVARVRYRADRLYFDRPDLRMRGALRAVASGDTVQLRLSAGEEGPCLGMGLRRICREGAGVEHGWALLMSPQGLPRWVGVTLSFVWMLGLVLPLGYFFRLHPLSVAGGLLLTSTSLSGWWIPWVAPAGAPALLAIVVGLSLGFALRKTTRAGECRRLRVDAPPALP